MAKYCAKMVQEMAEAKMPLSARLVAAKVRAPGTGQRSSEAPTVSRKQRQARSELLRLNSPPPTPARRAMARPAPMPVGRLQRHSPEGPGRAERLPEEA